MWIGTAGGVDRFRESRLTRVELPRGADGFAVAAGDAGAVLVGIDSDDGVFKVTAPSERGRRAGPHHITCAYRDDDGVVWFGGRGMLWHSSGSPAASKWIPIEVPVDRANADYYPVQAIAKDRAGGLWVSRRPRRRPAPRRRQVDRASSDPPLSLASRRGRTRVARLSEEPDSSRDGHGCRARALRRTRGSISATSCRCCRARRMPGSAASSASLASTAQRFHAVTQRGGRQLPTVSGIVATPRRRSVAEHERRRDQDRRR